MRVCYPHKLTALESDSQCSRNSPPGETSKPSAPVVFWGLEVRGRCARVPYPPLSTPVGYPSAPLSNYQPTVEKKCARIVQLAGRWIKSDSGVGISFGQMRIEARYLGRRKLLSYGRLGLFLDLECLLQHGNFQKFSQYFLSKFSFDKLSWVFEFCLRKFFGILSKWVFQVQVRIIME
jgi:hypothetical protein